MPSAGRKIQIMEEKIRRLSPNDVHRLRMYVVCCFFPSLTRPRRPGRQAGLASCRVLYGRTYLVAEILCCSSKKEFFLFYFLLLTSSSLESPIVAFSTVRRLLTCRLQIIRTLQQQIRPRASCYHHSSRLSQNAEITKHQERDV